MYNDDDKLFNASYMNALAKEVYMKNKNSNQGIDMVERNHVKAKNITAGMKLFQEEKDTGIISTYYNRIEIRNGNKLEVIKTR